MYSSSGAALEPSNSGDGESTDSGPKTDCSSGGTTTLSRLVPVLLLLHVIEQ